MDRLKALGRGTQLMFIASVLLLIISFFNWQEVSFDLAQLNQGVLGLVLAAFVLLALAAAMLPSRNSFTQAAPATDGSIASADVIDSSRHTVVRSRAVNARWPATSSGARGCSMARRPSVSNSATRSGHEAYDPLASTWTVTSLGMSGTRSGATLSLSER